MSKKQTGKWSQSKKQPLKKSHSPANKPGNSPARAWITVHVYLPLLPYFLEVFIRLGVKGFDFSWSTLFELSSASTLAISFGFICFFVYQDLMGEELKLRNPDRNEDRKMWATRFIIACMVFLVLFGIIMYSEVSADYHQHTEVLGSIYFFKTSLFFFSAIMFRTCRRLPISFDLRAKL